MELRIPFHFRQFVAGLDAQSLPGVFHPRYLAVESLVDDAGCPQINVRSLSVRGLGEDLSFAAAQCFGFYFELDAARMELPHRLLAADGLDVPGQDGIDRGGVGCRRGPGESERRTDQYGRDQAC